MGSKASNKLAQFVERGIIGLPSWLIGFYLLWLIVFHDNMVELSGGTYIFLSVIAVYSFIQLFAMRRFDQYLHTMITNIYDQEFLEQEAQRSDSYYSLDSHLSFFGSTTSDIVGKLYLLIVGKQESQFSPQVQKLLRILLMVSIDSVYYILFILLLCIIHLYVLVIS